MLEFLEAERARDLEVEEGEARELQALVPRAHEGLDHFGQHEGRDREEGGLRRVWLRVWLRVTDGDCKEGRGFFFFGGEGGGGTEASTNVLSAISMTPSSGTGGGAGGSSSSARTLSLSGGRVRPSCSSRPFIAYEYSMSTSSMSDAVSRLTPARSCGVHIVRCSSRCTCSTVWRGGVWRGGVWRPR